VISSQVTISHDSPFLGSGISRANAARRRTAATSATAPDTSPETVARRRTRVTIVTRLALHAFSN
jgi:hypothetical protein